MTITYQDFLEAKAPIPAEDGRTDITAGDINPLLFPHQRAIVEWAVRGGRRAIFAAFGLGKSVMQLETLRLVTPPGRRALIICPLGVRAEFAHDGAMLDIPTRFVRRTDEVDGPGIYLTNYESVRDGKLDVSLFDAVSLDEASVLRSFGSKTYISFLQLFDQVPYRFVATATPSPKCRSPSSRSAYLPCRRHRMTSGAPTRRARGRAGCRRHRDSCTRTASNPAGYGPSPARPRSRRA